MNAAVEQAPGQPGSVKWQTGVQTTDVLQAGGALRA